MKKQTFVLLCLFAFLFSGYIKANFHPLWEERAIQGTLSDIEARSSMKPIELYLSNELKQLCLCINRPYGQLEITIVDELNNQVYESDINVTAVTQEIISIGYLGKGNYTIYITNSEGKFVSGDFDLY